MKPNLQLTETRSRRDACESLPHGSRAPRIDFQFRPNAMEDFSGWGGGRRIRSLRGISDEYFAKEARHHFATEAGFFAIIVVTVAVPLFQVVRTLLEWVL